MQLSFQLDFDFLERMVAQPLLPKINLSGFKGYYFDNYVDHKDLKLGGDLFHALFHHALSSRVISFRIVIEGGKPQRATSRKRLGSNPDLCSTNAYDMRCWEHSAEFVT